MNLLQIALNEKRKDNFLYISKELANHLNLSTTGLPSTNIHILKLKKISTDEIFFGGWYGGITNKENTIEISANFGKCQNLFHGDILKFLENVSNGQTVESITLIPMSNTDYRKIEANASFLEENLLNQIMVVSDGLIFPFIFYDNTVVYLRVKSDIKNSYLILSQECEAEVMYTPPPSEKVEDSEEGDEASTFQINKVKVQFSDGCEPFVMILPCINENVSKMQNKVGQLPLAGYLTIDLTEDSLFRFCDNSSISKYSHSKLSQANAFPYHCSFWINVVINQQRCNAVQNQILLPEYLKMNTLIFPNDSVNLSLKLFADSVNIDAYNAMISPCLIIEYITPSNTDNLSTIPLKIIDYMENLTNKFGYVVVNFDFPYEIAIEGHVIVVKFNLSSQMNSSVYKELLRKVKWNVNDESKIPPLFLNSKLEMRKSIIKYSNELNIIYAYAQMNKMNRHVLSKSSPPKFQFIHEWNQKIIAQDSTSTLNSIINFYRNRSFISTAVIETPKEYDIQSFIEVLSSNLRQFDHTKKCCVSLLNFALFPANTMIDVEMIEHYLKAFFLFELSNQSRTIFIFQGLERFKKVSDSESLINTQLTYQLNRMISYRLSNFLSKCNDINSYSESGNLVYVIFLLQGCRVDEVAIDFFSCNSLYDRMRISYISQSIITEIMIQILNYIGLVPYDAVYLNSCSEYCKSFVIADIIKILTHLTSSSNNANTKTHLMNCISTYIPINVLDEKIIKTTIGFSSIGGLAHVKEELCDFITLSLKSSALFNGKPPILLSSGALLIGPPGCGKTLIASAIPAEFKINFYLVKGPEILNKYIGASEAAIRDIFENAKKNVPCVIFFDEFDSLAPKRGTGSSGVTDRIVNQLLTYLDGVESREGVFVLGASSRPDLLDPAILRPGRLDKILLCDFPSKHEREEILRFYYIQAHNGDQRCMTDIINDTLITIALNSEFFTGADLQSLIYNSFLLSVKRCISMNLTDTKAVINEDDLKKAFAEFHKSMTEKEILHHRDIIRKFSKRLGKDFQMENENDNENNVTDFTKEKCDNEYTSIDLKTTLY